ncbi:MULTISPECIES: hypothetical protein [unclassified Lysobacter]|uniref:hypothetical protein n=1 Tax=unclassified Lysobacter TaxID=2635362 RepID=UPI001BEAD6C0|nr:MULTISPECIES: hypothetical protein [unclassified Lysobacter]MBT2747550.1 hypothetical protein [Lysobacter sp. ISL-42]MBT2752373.1 hypothetical protein [Lysobacter sp. ISL-50]MBT2776208.1 hypothetical protein [Lysobacter sp. ISL-54]MBT2784292.1 hypothetical protein [Lysobacter sp. ISL-52]
MNLKRLALLCVLALTSHGAFASQWTSLGRLNAPTGFPNAAACQLRVINHYWSSKPIHTPTVVNTYGPTNVQYVFPLDLQSLRTFTSNSVSLSRFKTALDFYDATTTAKSIYASVTVGDFAAVTINVSYADAAGLIQGRGWSIDRSELQWYELQESCPQ